MDASTLLPMLLGAAVLLPLLSFTVIVLAGPNLGEHGKAAGTVATAAILGSAILSFLSLFIWLGSNWPEAAHHGGDHAAAAHDTDHGHASPDGDHGEDGHAEGDHGDEHAEGEHGEGEHAEGEHAEGEHAEGEHAEGEHAEGEHADEHGEGGHAEGDHANAGGQVAAVESAVGALADHEGDAHADDGHGGGHGHAAVVGPHYTGEWYSLGQFGKLRMAIGYYIDALTICMFCMVTLIASCIHFYATGYMHDELHDFTDPEVTMSDGSKLKRPGRYHRFFQALSLFCFSMLGLVIAGNVAMTFVFWELVGICSFFLIGFYVERKSASTAANKAFIVNRVGDFGMIIGLMALWGSLGTFNYGTIGEDPGLFESVRPAAGNHELVTPPAMARMASPDKVREVILANPGLEPAVLEQKIDAASAEWVAAANEEGTTAPGYWLLIVAGVGIFCGCVGKSAQFPLHVWLPTRWKVLRPYRHSFTPRRWWPPGVPCSSLSIPCLFLKCSWSSQLPVRSRSSWGRPLRSPQRTSSVCSPTQRSVSLGYMMLALGVGGWLAGVMHLFTHAFFKSLLFMCSGSVIHAVHTNEMPEMGGLRKKMPYTAYTMLIGCLAIAGAGVPFLIGMSGYYSKDAILEQAFSFRQANPGWGVLFFLIAASGAAITAFYMFRLWYMTFVGEPRDMERYDHAHESPKSMYVPLIVCSVFAIGVAWKPFGHGIVSNEALLGAFLTVVVFGLLYFIYGKSDSHASHDEHAHDQHSHGHDDHGHHDEVTSADALKLGLTLACGALAIAVVWSFVSFGSGRLGDVTLAQLLEQARPAGTAADQAAALFTGTWPDEHFAHLEENFTSIVAPATMVAFSTAFGGFMLATVMYCWGWVDPAEVKRQFSGLHRFLTNKWWFDELYEIIFIQPAHFVAGLASKIDLTCIDWFLHKLAWLTTAFSSVGERVGDQTIVDGLVNKIGSFTYGSGLKLRVAQTGSLRQYVMFIGAGTVAVFALASFFWGAGFGQ